MPAPVVSVVIPTFNRARDLQRALQSVAQQTFREWEVLVVDQYSTDETDAVVERLNDPRVRLIKARGIGAAPSRNVGLRNALGEFIAFLDSDDWWAPRKLEVSVAALRDGADVVYHDLYLVTRARQRVFLRRVRSRQLRAPVREDLLRNDNGIPLSSVLARKDLLLAVGGMPEDPSVIAMEDYECWLSIARRTERFRRVQGTWGYYWSGGGNTSSDARMLKLLDVFETLHTPELDRGGRRNYWWVPYSRGRIYYRAGNREAARAQFRLASSGPLPPMARLKTIVMQVALALRWSRG